MSRPFPLAVFAIVFSAVYIYSFATGWTLWRYYPLSGDFSTLDLPRDGGPAMGWYSWIAQGLLAALAAAIMAMILPARITEKAWSGLASAGVFVIVVYTFYYEWHWFQGN